MMVKVVDNNIIRKKYNKRIIILIKYTDCGKKRKKRILIVNIIMRY